MNMLGTVTLLVADVKIFITSDFTSVRRGASRSFQSGNSSLRALGSKTLPLNMCAPIYDPFSRRQTEISSSFSWQSYFNLIALARPKHNIKEVLVLLTGRSASNNKNIIIHLFGFVFFLIGGSAECFNVSRLESRDLSGVLQRFRYLKSGESKLSPLQSLSYS